MINRRFASIAVLSALLGASGLSQAATFDNVGDQFSGNFNGIIDGDVTAGLTANVVYELLAIDDDATGGTDMGTDWTFKITVTNTSTIDQSRVSGLGFNSDPDVESLSIDDTFNDDTFDNYLFNGNVAQLGPREVCFFDRSNSTGPVKGKGCSGGGSGGVFNTLGNMSMFVATLMFGDAIETLNLSDLYVRYQSINDAALGLKGDSGVGELSAVPLPAAAWLFLTGLAGLFGWQRRARKANTA